MSICECQGQGSLMTERDEAWEPRKCLHCGRPTPEKKWRCVECQAKHDAKSDGMLEAIRAARREESRITHADA
jgi:hypothetical protein